MIEKTENGKSSNLYLSFHIFFDAKKYKVNSINKLNYKSLLLNKTDFIMGS